MEPKTNRSIDNCKQDLAGFRQQIEERQSALRQAYKAHILELSKEMLSILERSEQELGLEALNQLAAERGTELYRETINARYADTGECPTLIRKLDWVYALHPQGPVLIVNESEEATGCYRGGYYGHEVSRSVEGRLGLDEFTDKLSDQDLERVCEKLIAEMERK